MIVPDDVGSGKTARGTNGAVAFDGKGRSPHARGMAHDPGQLDAVRQEHTESERILRRVDLA